MWASAVIEVEVTADRSASLADAVVGAQIHLLVFYTAPQPLDKDVVAPSSFAVHADRNAVVDEHAGERRAGELRTLIRVKDFRLAVMSECVLQRLDTERRLHRDRDPPRQHA